MAQYIKQGNIFGRLGTGIGKGFAEQLPKEFEHQRLRSGLQNLADKSGELSPEQFLAEAAGTYGITPQMIQSFGDIAQKKRMRSNYGNEPALRNESINPQLSQGLSGVNFANRPSSNQDLYQKQQMQPAQLAQSQKWDFKEDKIRRDGDRIPQTESPVENPLSNKFVPVSSWSPQKKQDQIDYELYKDPDASIEQAIQRADAKEKAEMAKPESERKIQGYLKGTQQELDDEFDKQLSTILQKQGKEIYADLTGETLLRLKKAAYEDLSTTPNANEKQIVEKWIKKGQHLVKSKGLINTHARRDFNDRISPGKKEENLKRLISAQKIFDETGNLDEFYEILKTKNSEDKTGYDLTPGGAALIAYPRSEPVKKLIKQNVSWGQVRQDQSIPRTRKFAQEISQELKNKDSLLAIAREMKQSNKNFNESAFFDYFRENQNNLGLSPHMQEELLEGVGDIIPNWGDFALFPLFHKSVAND